MQLMGKQAQHFDQLAFANPLLEAAMTGLIGRILGGHLRPLCTAAKNPEHTMQHCPRVVPGAAAVILATRRAQQRLHQLPLFVCQFPTACHAGPQRRLEQLQSRRNQTTKCL